MTLQMRKTRLMKLIKGFQRLNQLLPDGGIPSGFAELFEVGFYQLLPILVRLSVQIVVVGWFYDAKSSVE